jgi:hypothetical protein
MRRTAQPSTTEKKIETKADLTISSGLGLILLHSQSNSNKDPRTMEVQGQGMRLLDDEEPEETWQIVYMSVVLFLMFAALLSDRLGPDSVMMTALTFCMAAGIVTVKEGMEGFSNEGVLTVMVSNADGVIFS